MDTYTARRYEQALYYVFGYNHAQPTYRTLVNPAKFAEFHAGRAADAGTVHDSLEAYRSQAPAAPLAV